MAYTAGIGMARLAEQAPISRARPVTPFELISGIKLKSAINFLFGENVANLAIICILYKFKAETAIAYAIAKAKIRYNAIRNLIAIEIGN